MAQIHPTYPPPPPQVRDIWGTFSLLITAATDPILGQRTQLNRLIADSPEG